jgi:hypothetical protein
MNLLQLSSSDSFVYIVAIIISLIVCIFITRYIFRIDTLVHYLKIQADLLIKIAKYNNVPHDEIYQVLGTKAPQNEGRSQASLEFENEVAKLVTTKGSMAAIYHVQNVTGVTPGSARTYVDELIDRKKLIPGKEI